MVRIAAAILLFTSSIGFCQTAPKEPDTLQSLLDEVRHLRQAIEGMTAASQRVQIALYQLQMQDSAVARATLRLDGVRDKCTGAELNRQHVAEDVRRFESGLASGTLTEPETKAGRERLQQLRTALERNAAETQSCQTAEAEASGQLRNDQAKLLELQDRIGRLDKALEQLSSPAR